MSNHTTHDPFTKLCECGCGQPAPIAKKTNKKKGHVKGQPIRFIRGHQRRCPLEERFWQKVDKRDSNSCWMWTACTNIWDYGILQVDGRTMRAHRVSYELHHGSIPDGMCVLHNCPDGDNPLCVNPAHLWLGTQSQNIADRDAKGRHWTPHGEKSNLAKLTPDDVRLIYELYNTGMFQKDIAAQYGVDQATISRIVNHKTWCHVE